MCSHIEIQARSSYVSKIPNGSVNRCANCHIRPSGGGPKNDFGLDVEDALVRQGRSFWTAILASKDSDGDGFTNGEELGDPEGDGVAIPGAAISLPGDANDFPNIIQPPVDEQAPEITLLGDSVMFITQGTSFVDPGAFVTDNLDADLSASVNGNVLIDTIGIYTLTYTATDEAGNQSLPITRLIHVQPPVDDQAPEITLLGDSVIFITQGTSFVDPGAFVTDNLDTDLSALVNGNVLIDTIGIYTLTYIATDEAGNQSLPITRLVHVIPSLTTLKIRREELGLVLEWEHGGNLQWAPTPTGPWTPVEAAMSPYSISIDSKPKFFRIR